MQKPQQRKYHSSCNRSVHRGTAHGKQEVKVCKRKTPHLFLMRSFLSPYGDGTMKIAYCAVCKKFSPPYGDKSKSALQGLDRQQMTFPSPCGEKLKFGTRTLMAWQRSFRPLTGMVPKSFEEHGFVIGFSPPYGDGTAKSANITNPMEFSSPCGDGMTLFEEKVNEYRFSSPYGDKLQFWQFSGTWEPIPGFRPLAGMVRDRKGTERW